MSLQQPPSHHQNASKDLKQDDIDYVKDCVAATLLQRNILPNLIVWIMLVFCISFIVWAKWATLDRITVAEGKVIPSSNVQVIQELFDGVVKAIPVTQGQIVARGQVLIELDAIHATADYRQAQAKLQALHAAIARLKAQAQHATKIVFPADIRESRPDLMARENDLFQQRTLALKSMLDILQQNYQLAHDELNIMRPLVKQGVTSRVELLRIEREVNKLHAEINKTTDEFRDEALSKINQLKAEAETLVESMSSLQNKMQRTVIRSPVHGVIKKMHTHTLGAVVKSGMDIIEIVPLEDNLLVEGKVKPSDIAFIHPGQAASVKITAYDFAIYGGLTGTVQYISADTILDERQEHSYYIVTVKTNSNHLTNRTQRLPIIPGMTATIHIIAGKRTVLDYLLKPILRARDYALTEH